MITFELIKTTIGGNNCREDRHRPNVMALLLMLSPSTLNWLEIRSDPLFERDIDIVFYRNNILLARKIVYNYLNGQDLIHLANDVLPSKPEPFLEKLDLDLLLKIETDISWQTEEFMNDNSNPYMFMVWKAGGEALRKLAEEIVKDGHAESKFMSLLSMSPRQKQIAAEKITGIDNTFQTQIEVFGEPPSTPGEADIPPAFYE